MSLIISNRPPFYVELSPFLPRAIVGTAACYLRQAGVMLTIEISVHAILMTAIHILAVSTAAGA